MKLSIVIICLNEEKHIRRCLDAIFRGDHGDLKVEVIIVDGGSSDRTKAIARQFEVRILDSPRGIPRQRNVGGYAATGDLLAYVDADVEILGDWFTAVRFQFSDNQYKIIGCAPYLPDGVAWIAKAYSIHRGNPNLIGSPIENREERYLATASLVMGRKVFTDLGGFREDLAVDEDTDFILRARDRKTPLIFEPNLAHIHHGEPGSVTEFFQRMKWGANYSAWFKSIREREWSKIVRMQYVYGMLFAICIFSILVSLVLNLLLPLNGVIIAALTLLTGLIIGPALRLTIKIRSVKFFFKLCAMYVVLGSASAAAMLGFGSNKSKRWR